MRLLRLYAQAEIDNRVLAMISMPVHIFLSARSQDIVGGIGHQALQADVITVVARLFNTSETPSKASHPHELTK